MLQQIVQQLFAQLLSFLRHNTSRNSWFTFIEIAGKRCLRLIVQTLVLKPGDMMCLRLVVQLVVTIPFETSSNRNADVIIADTSSS
ncbi:importin subunit beta-1-like [Dorcoceras hygrometricum]|uniref:Importin subunit beta-1-like n=1 Tax=Dorcoceras hygrometricum TaxID=472368 RepID=A0A2Z7AAU9_9LAMI|nr:importin subunit beta-1-like [Dorcoceras hygrometricum]